MRQHIARLIGHLPIRFRGKDRIVRLLHPPGVPLEFSVPFYGTTYSGNTETFIDWNVWVYGAYERAFISCWRRAISSFPDIRMLDIGANTGHHIQALRIEDTIAFEPDPLTAQLLKSRTNARIEQVALSDKSGIGYLQRSDVHGLRTGSLSTDGIEVQLRRLDDYGFSGPLFIKIDVDGGERAVIDGAKATLQTSPILLHIETTDQVALAELEALGYRGIALSDWYGVPKFGHGENHLFTNAPFRVEPIDSHLNLIG